MSRLFPLFAIPMLLASCAATQPRVSEQGIPPINQPPGSVPGEYVTAIAMTTTTDRYCRKTTYDRQVHDEGNGRATYGPWRLVSDVLHRLDADASGHRVDPCDDDKPSTASAH